MSNPMTLTPEQIELKPCPFCGSEVERRDAQCVGDADYIVHKPKVGGHRCGLKFSDFNMPEDVDVSELWNRRALEPPTDQEADAPVSGEDAAKTDLRCVAYARALEKMRLALVAVHDGLEDEGDRVYLGSSNHADLLHEAWHLADALHWDEIMADTQPNTALGKANLSLQAEIASQATIIEQLQAALNSAGTPIVGLLAANARGTGERQRALDDALAAVRAHTDAVLAKTSLSAADCPSCGGLNISHPVGCGRDPETGELDGSTLVTDTPAASGEASIVHRPTLSPAKPSDCRGGEI
jgi:hypothetical protein